MVRRFLVVTVSVVVVLVSTALIAEPGNSPSSKKPRMLGKGNPFLLHDLPPGRVRSKIEGLPFQAWNRAMDWLHRFEFPENDLESMDVDNQGGVLYTDQAPVLPAGDGEPAPATEGEVSWQGAAAVDNAFLLHSRAGAPRVVYLDFNGHIFSGTAWSNGTISAAAFDLDEDPGTFNETERNFIAEIWHRVAEDFSAFDIDVTTEEPAVFDRHTGRILITSKTQTNGSEMPYSSYGGVAYIGVWGGSDYATYYSPALVYYDNLAKFPTYIAEASSHEFGHNLGLSHDGTGSTTYYGGHGSGATSWAPIMGNSYSRNVTQWSKGEYQGANNTQDDIGIIASELTMADDDHGDTMVQATPLTVDVNGQILVSNPELDPDNDYPDNKGKIESSTDQDMFYFQAAAGPIDLTVVPAWDAFYRDNKRGANLDIQASLLDESGAVLATSNPAAETDASISINVPGGNYYLVVTGVGSSNFSAYASTGQYFISGSISVTASNLPPIADFGVTCNDLNCAFVDYSSDPDGSITAWFWDFGDGATSSSPSPSHSFASAGSYPVSLRVTDNDDDTDIKIQSLTVTIDDIIPPVVTPPADITREATALATPVDLGTATSDDGSPVVHDAPSGGFPLGTTTVTWSATDGSGNTGSATQQVTIVDTTPPQITPPADITLVSGGDIGTATATDIFPVNVTHDAPDVFPVGTTLVTWTATDSSGNSASATQTVTVNNPPPPPPANGIDFNAYPLSAFANQDLQGSATIEDDGATLWLAGNTWKRIDFPYAVTPQTVLEFDFQATGPEGTIHGIGLEDNNKLTSGFIFKLFGTRNCCISTFDNYPGEGWVHYRIPVGQYYTRSMLYLVFSMDDDRGVGAASRFRNVKVYDESGSGQGPVVTPPADITREATALATPVDLGTATSDDGSPVVHDAPSGGFPLGTTTVTWSATDGSGNTGSATQQVTIVDTTPPQITPPADITLVSGGDIGTATATDIFPVNVTHDAPDVFPAGTTLVTWTATDSSGNNASATQTVTVNNPPPPPPANGIDFNAYPLSAFADQDLQGSATIEDGGATLWLAGNTWKRIDFPYAVTPQTVLEFDFQATGPEGTIHGIGLEDNNKMTSGFIFKLFGTRNCCISTFDNYPGEGWVHYRIPIGQYYTRNMLYLVFAMDDDRGVGAASRFRNVRVYDE